MAPLPDAQLTRHGRPLATRFTSANSDTLPAVVGLRQVHWRRRAACRAPRQQRRRPGFYAGTRDG